MTFRQEADAAQINWKQETATLDDCERRAGEYRGYARDFCVPRAAARKNLLPDAHGAIDYFAAAGIPWHDGIDCGPSNHLCSSQVQCANALMPMAGRPDAIERVFGDALQIATPLPMCDPVAPGAFVAFESIGDGNPLGEWKNGVGTRGAHNTSADAALRYIDTAGREVLTLIEWKYTEQYVGAGELQTSTTSMATRDARYRRLFDDPDAPLRHDVIPYDDFYVEPVYQLFRLSLLAWRLEVAGAADIVRVLYCAPGRNAELWASLNRESHAGAGNGHLGDLWRNMQRRPDRFEIFDTAQLVGTNAATSAEFKCRYAHMAADR